MHRGRARLVVIASLAVGSASLQSGCSGRPCNQDARNGLAISVRDARTGAALCDSVVVAVDGSYREDLPNYSKYGAPPPCPHGGANERAGTYRLEVSCPGFLPRAVANLVVSKDPEDCHISNTVMLTVDLEPDPNAARELDAAIE